MTERTLQIVAGAQYGSEAKGHVTHRLTQQALNVSWHGGTRGIVVVRVAGPNAGHTVYNRHGIRFALRQIPVAAVEDEADLVIAAGSEIDPDVLLREINDLRASGHDISGRLYIDPEATLIRDSHKIAEISGEHLIDKIGSTGKGIGAARADRAMRRAERLKDDPGLVNVLESQGAFVLPTGAWLNNSHAIRHVIVEGTQGYGLGQHAGHYPQVTSSDCRAIDFAAMAGIAPWAFKHIEVWLVARVFPIRVAGNSGPLADETTWEALGLPEERTTVTQKIRRVGGWDPQLVAEAVANNGGKHVNLALTMVDQKIPGLADKQGKDILDPEDEKALARLILEVERDAGCKVRMVTTGPRSGWLL